VRIDRRIGPKQPRGWIVLATMLLMVSQISSTSRAQAKAAQPPIKDLAQTWAQQLMAAFPKPPKGWRIGTGAIYGDQIMASDQGAGQRWRYLPTATRVYLSGGGKGQKQLRLRAVLAPVRWVSEKRRQMTRLAEKAAHCVSQPTIDGQMAWLLGWFDAAARKRQPRGNTCVPGARLIVLSGRAIITLSTSHHVGNAGLMVARGIRYKAIAKITVDPNSEKQE
jgi:hypothetical protein